jgi:putative NIF3 family GTP cyclohydrolase 1 type 2
MKVKKVVETIKRACSSPDLEKTCDLLISGDWDDEVKGIVTTFMATVDVIKKASDKGVNMIITHEPTYFTSWEMENTDWMQEDEVYQKKRALIEENEIIIWRFHDHMHMHDPDLIFVGMERELGWEGFKEPQRKHVYEIPRTTVRELTQAMSEKLGVGTPRIVGNPEDKIERVALLVGGGSLGLGREEMPMELMRKANLDTIVCGEILEWTLCAYARDASQLGFNKSLIILGHNRTEEAGMKYLPEWLSELLPDMPITFIESGEPFKMG